MRRRRPEDLAARMPESLLIYDPPTKDATEWRAGYKRWEADRAAWGRRHGIADPLDVPYSFVGDEPFDASLI